MLATDRISGKSYRPGESTDRKEGTSDSPVSLKDDEHDTQCSCHNGDIEDDYDDDKQITEKPGDAFVRLRRHQAGVSTERVYTFVAITAPYALT